MPNKPKRLCAYPGCGEVVESGYCEKHTKQKRKISERRRKSSTERGYDSRWRRYRTVFLKKNPLCVSCQEEGIITPATVVDHIVPHKGDMKLFWDTSNHQALCKRCHDIKTATEDGGFGNRIKKG